MESEWVKIMPFIEHPLPVTAVNSDFPGVSESKEIYEYFQTINQQSPLDEFRLFYSQLPILPRMGQTKKDQIIEAVRLRKLADNVKRQMEEIGVKW